MLASLLFIKFINDLPKYVQSCNLYADDTMIEKSGQTLYEIISYIQSDIDNLLDLFYPNNLTVNKVNSGCRPMLIIVAYLQNATNEYTSESLCVSVLVCVYMFLCVCVCFCTITEKEIDLETSNFKYIVVYEIVRIVTLE